MWALAATGEELSVTPKEYTKEEELVAISVDAVNGGEGNKTVRLWASVHCQQVLVLVYSGSSASFMGSHLLGVMKGIQVLPSPVQVKVVDGRILDCKYEVPNYDWLCDGVTFTTTFKILPSSDYDLILGVDWLECHSLMSIHWRQK